MQYKFESDDNNEYPSIPRMGSAPVFLLDINKLSSNMPNIVEEAGDDSDDGKYFENIDYETDSDCDSNDSVVVKKEIVTHVGVDEINDFDWIWLWLWWICWLCLILWFSNDLLC